MPKLTQSIVGWKRDDLIAVLDAVEVPVGPVNDVAEILNDPHVAARGLVRGFNYPGVGNFKGLGLPYKFQGFDDPRFGRPPTLGEHTDEVLKTRLGYSAEKIAQLREAKAL
jgi:crotonobetainyl-CoA:carnitine CoA-transferase CaiB-like acyl-CoA transferase